MRPTTVLLLLALAAPGCSCSTETSPDGGTDAPSIDGGTDASVFDGGPLDVPTIDAGLVDTGIDAPAPDAGETDAGTDGGAFDAGPPPPVQLGTAIASDTVLMLPLGITETTDGDVIVVGRARVEGSGNQAFAVRLSPALETRWLVTFGGDLDDTLNDVVALPGGDVIAVGATMRGSADGAPYLVRISASGDVVWSERLSALTESVGSTPAGLVSVTRAPDGTLYAFGSAEHTGTGADGLVVHVDGDGELLHQTFVSTSGSSTDDHAQSVVTLADGRPVVALTFTASGTIRAGLVALAADLTSASWALEHRDDAGSIRVARLTRDATGLLYLSARDPLRTGQVRALSDDGAVSRVVGVGRAQAIIGDADGLVLGGSELDEALIGGASRDLATPRFVQTLHPEATATECAITDLVSATGDHTVALLPCAATLSPSSRPFFVVRAALDGLSEDCVGEPVGSFFGAVTTSPNLDPDTARLDLADVDVEPLDHTATSQTVPGERACD